MKKLERIGSVLGRINIPTRYPNGLPEMTPDSAFSREDAKNMYCACGENPRESKINIEDLMHAYYKTDLVLSP
jgi:hypothetical protein